jgi:hypothetical protein
LKKTISGLLGLILLLISSVGCHSSTPEWNFPFTIDANRSIAYPLRDSIEVYLVGDRDVIALRFALPIDSKIRWEVKASSESENTITHFSGPNVAQYVLPRGPFVPFPKTSEYVKTVADEGKIISIDPPVQRDPGEFQIGKEFLVCLEDVQFSGDVNSYSGCQAVKTSLVPP